MKINKKVIKDWRVSSSFFNVKEGCRDVCLTLTDSDGKTVSLTLTGLEACHLAAYLQLASTRTM